MRNNKTVSFEVLSHTVRYRTTVTARCRMRISLSRYYDRESINYISDMCIAKNNEIPLIRLYTCQRVERVHTNRFNRTRRVRRPEHGVGRFKHSVL